MLYMLLICYDPSRPADPERGNLQPEHAKLEAELRKEGTYVSGAGLWPAAQSKVVRRAEGKVIRTDGAFAETKEVVGGYFMVDCEEEEALSIAERIPVDSRSWIRVQAVALFHPDAKRVAAAEGYVHPRLRGMVVDARDLLKSENER
jgi:hypothetical protein